MNSAIPAVLIVDDDEDICRNLSDICAELGYHVATACDGHSALAKARQERFEIAVLDLMMPTMDGLSLYRELKKLRPEIVALLSTAYPAHPRAEESQGAGIWRIVPKPVDVDQLLSLIDEALNQPLVLVVDDDTEYCANLWDLLRLQGFRVGMAHDVRTAIRCLGENRVGLVLIDMRLPDGDGADICRMALHREPRVRTIIITAYREEVAATLEDLLKQGLNAVCYKPLDMAELCATIRRLSGRED